MFVQDDGPTITLEEARVAHSIIMVATGEEPSTLRDRNALEAALQRPRWLAYYEQADVIRQAAMLMVAVSQAQAFVSGNKRTAFAVGVMFLEKHDLKLVGNGLDVAQKLVDVAEATESVQRAAAYEEFVNWLRSRAVPRSAVEASPSQD